MKCCCGGIIEMSGYVMDSLPPQTSGICGSCGVKRMLYGMAEGGPWTESREDAKQSWREARKRRMYITEPKS